MDEEIEEESEGNHARLMQFYGGEATLTLGAGMVNKKPITILYSGDTNDEPSSLTTTKLT